MVSNLEGGRIIGSPWVSLWNVVEATRHVGECSSGSEGIAVMLDAVERSCWDHIDKVLDVTYGPNHMEVHLEFGTDVFRAAADVSIDALEASGGEGCTNFIKQCGDDGLVVTDGSGSTFWFVTVKYSGKQVEFPCCPRGIGNGVVATAERSEYEVGEVVQYIVIWFVESSKSGGVR